MPSTRVTAMSHGSGGTKSLLSYRPLASVSHATDTHTSSQIMISFWIDYGTNFIGGTTLGAQSDASWMVPVCLQIVPALVLFFGMLFMPFSPRWLAHHGREDEARRVLANLRGLPADHELVELEFLEIKAQSLFEKRTVAEKFPHLRAQTAWNTFKLQFVAIGSLFRTKAMLKRVMVATVTMFFQQWTGINVSACVWRRGGGEGIRGVVGLLTCGCVIGRVVLCADYLQAVGFGQHRDQSVGHWCGGHRYVVSFFPPF